MAMFCFDSADCGPAELALSELSGDFCGACYAGVDLCPNKSRIGEIIVDITLKQQGNATTRSSAARKHLLDRGAALLGAALLGEAQPLDHAMVVSNKGADLEPMQLVDAKTLQGNKVAVYCAYDYDEATAEFSINERALCSRKIEVCGVRATPPCFKRHVQTIPR